MSLIAAILDSRRERRFETLAPESISQDPSKSLLQSLGGRPAASGQPVTVETAHGIPTVFACDLVIKQDIAKTPIKLKRRLPDGTRRDDTDHPVYVALHDMPNRAMTPYEFKETMQHSLNLWGNAYAEIVRHPSSVNGLRMELWPLDPWRMTVGLNAANQLEYAYVMPNGQTKRWVYDPVNPPIFHLRQHTKGGILGRSPIQVLRESMGIALARESYSARFYGQGGHAQTQITGPQKLSAEAAKALRQDYEEVTVNARNWHRPVVLPFGFEAKPIAMPHRDAQFIDQMKLTRSEIAGAFRVSAHLINDLEKATFSNIEHLQISHVGNCLMPHFVCWEQAIKRDLLNAKGFETHFAVFVYDALVRGDFKTFNEGLNIQRQNGIISGNDWRRLTDSDDQIPADQGGDDYLVNGTMVPIRREPAPVGGVN